MSMRAQYRERHIAIGRKAAYETEFLFAEDDLEIIVPPLKPTFAQSKQHKDGSPAQLESPISVASTLDIQGEMKSLELPGSWMVVGKGGKPMKNGKMYDEPANVALAKKKKKKKQSSKADAFEAEPLVATLEETASSSKCLRELHLSATKREKLVARAQDAKRWARYRRCKQLNRAAVEHLVASLSAATAGDGQEGEVAALPMAWTTSLVKDNKANSLSDKARRRARSAAAAARCASGDADEHANAAAPLEGEPTPAPPPTPVTRAARPHRVSLHGEWTTIGKRGKAVPSHSYAPTKLAPNETPISGNKRLEERSEQLAQKPPKKRGKNADKSKKCTVM